LSYLLKKLETQETRGLFSYSIVVVDNDYCQSAKEVTLSAKERGIIDVDYYVEPNQNISLARNKAIQKARGNLIAFIDDDEFPDRRWLLMLFKKYKTNNVHGVLGIVLPYFKKEIPNWLKKVSLYKTGGRKSGTVLKWNETYTGNVLIVKEIFLNKANFFAPEFGKTGGEDLDFFKRMIEKGYIFISCNEAIVYGVFSSDRLSLKWIIKRSIRGGINNIMTATIGKPNAYKPFFFLKSLFAILVYSVLIPCQSIFGLHKVINFMIKMFCHVGKILWLSGYDFSWHKNMDKNLSSFAN